MNNRIHEIKNELIKYAGIELLPPLEYMKAKEKKKELFRELIALEGFTVTDKRPKFKTLESLRKKRKKRKKYVTKYSRYGVNRKQVKAIYSKLRITGYCILKNKHKQEYKEIMKLLLKKELCKICKGKK
jgi:hypothetical protein